MTETYKEEYRRNSRSIDKWWTVDRKEYEYLFTDMESWGDRQYWKNKKTGEIVDVWISIGD